MGGVTYRVTEAGRAAWESRDPAVPSDYRMILWLLDFRGSEHLEAWIGNFRERASLRECLDELRELRLIEPIGAHDAPRPEREAPVFEIDVAELADAADALAKQGAYVARGRRAPALAKPGSETVVLIVEDDPDQLALADLRVSMAGYSVRVADSQSALVRSLVDEGIPDLLLLDVMLPDGDGFDILRRLRALPRFAALPIVLLTARKEPKDIENGLRLGADAYITKPYSKNILASVIARILKNGPVEGEMAGGC